MSDEIVNDLLVVCANLKRRLDREFAIKYGLQSVLGNEINFLESVDARDPNFVLPNSLPEKTRKSSYAVRLTKIKALEMFLALAVSVVVHSLLIGFKLAPPAA